MHALFCINYACWKRHANTHVSYTCFFLLYTPMTVLSMAIFCTTKKIRRQFPQTQQKGYLCRRKKFNMSFLCWIICCRNKSVMYTIYVWTFNETHLAKCTVASREITCARNVPEVASRHTVFQNFPYPALSLTRMPPWQPNSAPPTLWFPHITFLKFENPVI